MKGRGSLVRPCHSESLARSFARSIDCDDTTNSQPRALMSQHLTKQSTEMNLCSFQKSKKEHHEIIGPAFPVDFSTPSSRQAAMSQRASWISFRSDITIIPFHSTLADTYHILTTPPTVPKVKRTPRAPHAIIGRNLLFPIGNIDFPPLPTIPTNTSTRFPIASFLNIPLRRRHEVPPNSRQLIRSSRRKPSCSLMIVSDSQAISRMNETMIQ